MRATIVHAGTNARIAALLAIALTALIISGCCGKIGPEPANQSGGDNGTVEPEGNRPPVVNLTLNSTTGQSPFHMYFWFSCYDPDDDLAFCEMSIDGEPFAGSAGQSTLLPENFTYPDFYYEALRVPGNHTIGIAAADSEGRNASMIVNFTVLQGAWLEGPGWYNCNENPYSPPCDYMYNEYCDKIVPDDLAVWEAAAEAISDHPGEFSLNQLLDIYDWVHENVFYQNVPIDMWPPYPPNETLDTKSGDCKNQAVLIASMVEATGGSARVLYIPECRHAFSEVYLGTDQDVNALSNAVWAHYEVVEGTYPTWHGSKNKDNQTENWFIFDTAGGYYPGNTIPDCMNATTVYYLQNCNRDPELLKAPVTYGTEYGPLVRFNESQILKPEYYYYRYVPPWLSTAPEFDWCHYKLNVKSLSTKPLDWYLTDENGYEDYADGRSFSYMTGEEQVMEAEYEFDWTESDDIYLIVSNPNTKSSITVRASLVETCYKSDD